MARFDPMATARRYADTIVRGDPGEMDRIGNLLERGDRAFERSGSRPARGVHRAQ